MSTSAFFKPQDGWVGDLIPFERDGEFHLFYLHEHRETPKPGTSWSLVTTRDFVHFDDHGVALEHGSDDAADFNAFTGSVVRDDSGVHHLFYTGQNPNRLGDDGQPLQLVMHATSSDGMATWVKHPELTFGAGNGYETADWRDPFVFKDGRDGTWRMVLAARHTEGPARRRGVIAQLVSNDATLSTWTPTEPFWDPRLYVTHECPDVFEWGDWWYLVYSEFSESFRTHYRMAKSPDGPWFTPPHDTIDGRAFYASKSAARDGRRFFFGWISSKDGDVDDGAWQWAGTMSTLEARQNADGTLAFSLPDELLDSFTEDVPVAFGRPVPSPRAPAHSHPPLDAAPSDTLIAAPLTTIDARAGYDVLVSAEALPAQFFATVTMQVEPNTTDCGLLVRSSADGDVSYILRLEPERRRMVFDRWPRTSTGDGQWQVSGDVPFEIELERPCDLEPGEHTIELLVDGTLCVAVLDRQVSLSTRIYDHAAGRLGLFATEGTVAFGNIAIRARPQAPQRE